MNSTPNYGFNLQICGADGIDRELNRIENRIDCLSKSKCDGYSKCEADKLLDGKVDRKEGFDLISNDCLRQICSNKDGIALLEQYIQELQERNNLLEADLEKKVEQIGPATWTPELVGLDGGNVSYLRQTGGYIKTGKSVTVWYTIATDSHTLAGNLSIGNLPYPMETVGNDNYSVIVIRGLFGLENRVPAMGGNRLMVMTLGDPTRFNHLTAANLGQEALLYGQLTYVTSE